MTSKFKVQGSLKGLLAVAAVATLSLTSLQAKCTNAPPWRRPSRRTAGGTPAHRHAPAAAGDRGSAVQAWRPRHHAVLMLLD